MSVTSELGSAANIGLGRRGWIPSLQEPSPAHASAELISFLQAIPDPLMRRGVRIPIPSWYLLLVAVLGILSHCQSLRDLERFAERHHHVLTEALQIELRRYPSDSAFRNFFQQVDDSAL